jgi:hypothetical protein
MTLFLEALNDNNAKRLIIINTQTCKERILQQIKDFPREQLDYLVTLFGNTVLFDNLLTTLTLPSRGFF